MKKGNKQLLSVIMDDNEIRWQSIIYNMIRSGKIDPWDVDITVFSKEYLKTLEKLKEMNFALSGKVVLAAAILLKIKTNRLGLEDFLELIDEDDEEDLEEELDVSIGEDIFVDEDEEKLKKLAEHIKKNKQIKEFDIEPNLERKKQRKVTVFELVSALRKAIDVDDRRSLRKREKKEEEKPPKFEIEKVDIRKKIGDVYSSILKFLKTQNASTVKFSKIVPSKEKKDIIWTFVPLLHLAHEGKVGLIQKRHFDDIYVQISDESIRKAIRKAEN